MLLIVEDEAVSRRALAHLLRLHGHETLVAGSAEEAATMLRRAHEEPDAAIVDVNLPGMSGVEFVRRLRRDHPQVPCVFMSANDEVNLDSLRFTQRQPALRKPFDVEALLHWLSEVPRRHGAAYSHA